MKAFLVWLLARLPWADFILAVASAVSRRMADLWRIVYECVSYVQQAFPDADGSIKLQKAKDCIWRKVHDAGLVAKESIIHLFIELAVQLLKLR